jgi:DNA-binding HxlR family transcriptional regulator
VNFNSIPEIFQSRVRLAIISALLTGDKTFSQIKGITHAADGSLSMHLVKLEEIKFVSSKKEFVAKKPRSTYSLTQTGKTEFKKYVELLEQILEGLK